MRRRRWQNSAVDSETLALRGRRGPRASSNLRLVRLLEACCFGIPQKEKGCTTVWDGETL